FVFFFQAEDGIRDRTVTGVQTCALPIWVGSYHSRSAGPTGPSTTVRTAARAMGSGPGGGGSGRRPPRQIGRRVDAPAAGQLGVEIGRASCREGGWRGVRAGAGMCTRRRG